MTVDAQIAALLPMFASAPPLHLGTAEAARAGMRLLMVDLRDPATLQPVGSVEETTYPAAEGDLRAKVYRPEGAETSATVLFIHGGGFVLGDVDTHDDQARILCDRLRATVFSIDYRLAPEHPFPAGHLDAVAAFEHVVKTVEDLGGDATRIGVAGDSAGGNLSAGVAQYARDNGLPLKAQLLIYPGVHFTEDVEAYASRVELSEGYFLTKDDMLWFRGQYQPTDGDPRCDVIAGDLEGLAPAVIATAEYDPLRDEGEAYAALLQQSGVATKVTRHPGLIHGFFGFGHLSAGAAQAIDQVCADFKEALA